MRFAVFTQQSNGLDQVVLQDEYARTRVIVLPAEGAMLHALIVQTKKGLFNIIDHYTGIESLQNELRLSYKSSKLSPFVCRIPEGKYTCNGKDLELENKHTDGSSIHGLLYDKPFTVIDSFCDDLQASIHLRYNYKKEDRGYPFEYRCEIRYTLMADNILQLKTTILNLDDSEIFLADGWHPYFKLGGKIDRWLLRFNADSIFEFDHNLVPTGHFLPNTLFKEERLIHETVLDNCFVLNKKGTYAACRVFNPENGLAVSLFPDHSYPYLLIYTPPHRESIAIENLSGAPNCFNNKMGLIKLPPGHTKTFTIQYQISME